MEPRRKVILVDGSSYPHDEQPSWALVAAVVEGSMHSTDVLQIVATSKCPEKKDCSVVELLAILAATRLARGWARKKGEEPVEFVVTDRPAIFSNIEFFITGAGTQARMPELHDTLDILVNDFARAATSRNQEARIVLLSRKEAVRRQLLGEHELGHQWTPHALIERHIFHGDKFNGDMLQELRKDEASLRFSSPQHRDACSWTCYSDRENFLELTCRPKTLPSRS